MPTERRTATYDTTLLERVERLRSSEAHHQALVELTGAEPRSLASTLSDLTALAVAVVERRVIERGYRQLAAEREAEYDVDAFLEHLALASLDGTGEDGDEELAPLLEFLDEEAT